MLEFQTISPIASQSTAIDEGQFKDFLKKGTKLFFSNKNLKKTVNKDGNYNRAIVCMESKAGDFSMIVMSQDLSEIVRGIVNKVPVEKILRKLLECTITRNEKGLFLGSNMDSNNKDSFERHLFDNLIKDVPVDFEELVTR
jgi:predicted nucleic acid-binding protein